MNPLLLGPLVAFVLSLPHFAQAPALPDPSGPLAVRGGAEAETLLGVAEAYARLLGLPLAADDGARAKLGRTRVGLLADLEVPAPAAHGVAQSLLVLGGFVITGVRGELRVAAYDPDEPGREALALDAGELARFAGHEAVLVRASASIAGIDPRTLTASLRALWMSELPGPVVLASKDDKTALEIEGPAESVRWLLDLLRRCADGGAGTIPPADLAVLFPARSGGELALAPDDRMLAVLERYVALTGRALWVGEPLRQRLAQLECGLLTPVRCSAAQADALVESMLAIHGIGITVRGPAAYAIGALQGGGPPFFAGVPRPVPVDLVRVDPELLRGHPATIFGGVIALPRHEVRQLTTSMRTLMTDSSTQAMLALADHALYSQGAGRSAALFAEMFGELDGRAPVGVSGTAGFAPASPAASGIALRAAPGKDEPSLFDLLAAWSRATGRVIVVTLEQGLWLRSRGLGAAEFELAAEDLDASIESLLIERGAALSSYAEDPPVCALAVDRGMPRLAAHRYVRAGDLDALAGFPAQLVTTTLNLERLEVRRAATELRENMRDTLQEHAIAAGDRQLVLGGTVASVRALVAQMRASDAAGELPTSGR
jgi:hypothetical protein